MATPEQQEALAFLKRIAQFVADEWDASAVWSEKQRPHVYTLTFTAGSEQVVIQFKLEQLGSVDSAQFEEAAAEMLDRILSACKPKD